MTEDEAKKKWCPFARLAISNRPNTPSLNRILDVDDPSIIENLTKCIGSDCMAWRVERTYSNGRQDCYCGLAGKP